MLSGKHLPYKSVISALLYIIAIGIERPSLQMCQGLSHIVLSVNTSRVDGPLLAIILPGGAQLVTGERTVPAQLIRSGRLTFPKTMRNCLLKGDYT